MHACMHHTYIHTYMIDKPEVYMNRRVQILGGTHFHLSNPGGWEAKGTCMQAGACSDVQQLPPQVGLKWPTSKSRLLREHPPAPKPVASGSSAPPSPSDSCCHSHCHCHCHLPSAICHLPPTAYRLPSTVYPLPLPLHLPFLDAVQSQPRRQVTCARPAAKEKRHSVPSSNARRVT